MNRYGHIALTSLLVSALGAQGVGAPKSSGGTPPQGSPASSFPSARPSTPTQVPPPAPPTRSPVQPAPVRVPIPTRSAPAPAPAPVHHVVAPPTAVPTAPVNVDPQAARSSPVRTSPKSNNSNRRPPTMVEGRPDAGPVRTPSTGDITPRTPEPRDAQRGIPKTSVAKDVPVIESGALDSLPPIRIRREPPPERPSSLSVATPRDAKVRGELVSTSGARGVVPQSHAAAQQGSLLHAPIAGVGSASLVMSGGVQSVGLASALVNGATPFGCLPFSYHRPGAMWISPVEAGWWAPPAWSSPWCGSNPWINQRPCYPRYYHGFGWSYSPELWCDTWYSSYRVYDYYPWNYYGSCSTPVIATVWYSTSHVSVTETSDPYVEFAGDDTGEEVVFVPAAEDRPGLASRPAPVIVQRGGALPSHASFDGRGRGVPQSLKSPLTSSSIARESAQDYLVASEKSARDGRWLEAAEELRQGFIANPDNAELAYRLASCLIPAGEIAKACDAIRAGVALEGVPTVRTADLTAILGDGDVLVSARAKLEGRLIDSSTDRDARFVLGWIYFTTGQAFSARNEFALLQSLAASDVEAKALGDAAERVFLLQGR